jgi:acyl-coenzyme A synthetase/AMP-(fatty) acid ligase
MRAGAVFVVLNPTIKGEKLRCLVEHCRATVIVTNAKHLDLARHEDGSRLELCLLVDEESRSGAVDYAAFLSEGEEASTSMVAKVKPNDLATLLYTSGTTGRPKGVMHTRANLSTVVPKITTYLENRSSDVILSVLPLSFGYGLTQLLTAVHSGACLVLEQRMGYPAALLGQIARHGVTVLPVVPTISAMLLRMDLRKFDLSSLRVITNAGAHLPLEQFHGWRSAAPKAGLFNMYGLTECIRASFLHPMDAEDHPGTIGRGLPGQQWGLFHANGEPVETGDVGELVIASDHMMAGYWEDPERTVRALRPNPIQGSTIVRALYTGDLFRSDGEGYLGFVSRRDDMINSRGEMVSPEEVEDVVRALPGILEVAVYGRADNTLGASIWACVVAGESGAPSEAEILRHCSANLEDHMVPQGIEFRQTLPKTPNGKIARVELSGAQEAMR